MTALLELYQTEWCPASRRVRQRLTELGLDYVVRQVSADRDRRTALVEATGADTVPALVLEDGTALTGEERILGHLRTRYPEPTGAWAHRARARKAERRYLEEECRCREPATR